MKFLFNVKSEILRQYTRFVDGHRIRLFVVRDTFSILGGFITFENRDVVVNWDPSKVKKEDRPHYFNHCGRVAYRRHYRLLRQL